MVGLALRVSAAIVIASSLALCALPAVAQIPREDVQRLALLRTRSASRDSTSSDATRSLSFPQMAAVGALHLYRAILSSQDAYRCQFSPSCSHFAEQAVRKAGTARGVLMASDRVQRCNPFAPRYYPRRDTNGRLVDPVEDHLPPAAEGSARGAGDSIRRAGHPLLATALSAVAPGLGKVYAGRAFDGLSSFIAVGVPTAFAVADFRRSGAGSVRGWFQSSLAAGFYVGGLWGAARASLQRDSRHGAGPLGTQTGCEADAVSEPLAERPNGASDATSAPPEQPLDLSTRYDSALAAYADGQFSLAASGFLDVAEIGVDTAMGRRARFFQALAHAEQGRWRAAHTALSLFTDGGASGPDSTVLFAGLSVIDSIQCAPRLSPATARRLSTVVPGLGQTYARHYGRAMMTFGLCAVLSCYVRSTLLTESYAELAVSALPLFWRYYRGGVQGAGHCTAAHNARLDERGSDALRATLGVPPR